jgi:hypothetical protein
MSTIEVVPCLVVSLPLGVCLTTFFCHCLKNICCQDECIWCSCWWYREPENVLQNPLILPRPVDCQPILEN